MSNVLRVLILEDRPADAELMLHELRQAGYEPVWERVEDEQGYLAALSSAWDVILADYHQPEFDALRALRILQDRVLNVPLIVVTAVLGDEGAAECIKAGASDYLLKDRLARLGPAVARAIEDEQLREEKRQRDQLFDIVPDILAMVDLEGRIRQVNRTVKSVLGYDVAEVVGKQFAAFVHVDDLATAAFRIRSQSRLEDPVECRLYCKDGTYKWLAWTGVVDHAYGLLYVVGRDVTSRKSLELHVRQRTEELVRANQHLSMEMQERARAEQSQRESEERYRHLVELAPDAVMVHCEGKLVFVNPAAITLLGATSAEQLIGRPIVEFVQADYQEVVVQRIREMSEQGTSAPLVEEKLIRLDGTALDAEVCSAPLSYSGRPTFMSIARDITKRTQAEGALRASEANFRAIYEHSPLGITLVDFQGRIVDVNPAFERMLGYSREEIIGSDSTTFTDPSSWKLQRRLHGALMRRERPEYQMEKRYRRKDGTEMRGRWTSTVLEQAGGSLVRLSMVEDVSERERAIEELSRVRRDWEDVFDSAPDSVIILDREQRIVMANKATLEAFGLTPEQLVGKHCYEIFHGTDRPVEGCPALAALASRDRAVGQVRVERLGREFQVSCVPMFDPSGKVDRIIHTAKDVTSSDEVTEELRRMKGEWRTVFESIDHPAMILDPEHGIVAVNAATTRAIGKPDQELLGKRCYEVFHGAEEPIHDCPMERALQSRQGERAEVSVECLHGQFMVSCSPIFDESGKLEKIMHIAIDVTDRVRAEEELRDNQLRLRAVFETLRVNKTGRFE